MLQDVWVSGEVANLRRSGTGHSYFTLRDDTGSLRCVLFLSYGGSERLLPGEAVIVHGRISIYERSGDLQLIVDLVQPEGVGELQLRLEELKLKLEREGLFERSRKRPLPSFPAAGRGGHVSHRGCLAGHPERHWAKVPAGGAGDGPHARPGRRRRAGNRPRPCGQWAKPMST